MKTTNDVKSHHRQPRRYVDIGMDAEAKKIVCDVLNKTLANEAVLVAKTRKAHWDIVGPQFYALHKIWAEHYEALTLRMDEIAERTRQLGGYPVATMAGWLEQASLTEAPGTIGTPTEAVSKLLTDHETIIRLLRGYIDLVDESDDVGTVDMLTKVILDHEQMAWVLRSFLEGEEIVRQVEPRGSIPDFA